LAIGSEVARLAFSLAGSTLCAFIFWVLAAGAAARSGPLAVSVATFAALALTASGFAALALRGLYKAIQALKRP
jgi:hypothetical protein